MIQGLFFCKEIGLYEFREFEDVQTNEQTCKREIFIYYVTKSTDNSEKYADRLNYNVVKEYHTIRFYFKA